MIIAIIGGVGSGKSLSAVKFLCEREHVTYTNFHVRGRKILRLKSDNIITHEITGYKKNGDEITVPILNWDYWKKAILKYGGFDIFIDEIHNIFNSRQSMTKRNILLMQWVAQIRKVLSGSEKNHLVCISQRLKRIDVSLRDLLHLIIYCKKVETNKLIDTTVYFRGKKRTEKIKLTYIIQYIFKGDYCVENYERFINGIKSYDLRTRFIANPYFKLFDSYELIDSGGDYL